MMGNDTVTGSCFCGGVAYQITGNMGIFQYCHCSRCRKFTGSAHSANLFVAPEQFSWTRGADQVGVYVPGNTRHFCTAFCKTCGSSLPWKSKTGKVMVIPAGTLDQHPGIEPAQNIFCASRAAWYQPASALPSHDELPPR